jgi:hypothetical protein
MENAGFSQQKRKEQRIKREMGRCTSCCSAIFLSRRDWLLFLMPCAVALAEDAFIATGAVLETGGLLCSFSIAEFELLSTATDPTEPISNGC